MLFGHLQESPSSFKTSQRPYKPSSDFSKIERAGFLSSGYPLPVEFEFTVRCCAPPRCSTEQPLLNLPASNSAAFESVTDAFLTKNCRVAIDAECGMRTLA
jgi:hypothetical protein